MTESKNKELIFLIALLVVIAFYALPTFEFLNIDDPLHLLQNPHLKPLTWSGLGELWKHPYRSLYTPATYTVWFLEGRAFGFNPAAFHTINFLLHVGSTFLVGTFLLQISHNLFAGIIGAAFFALHPLQVEAVSWVSGMKDLLSAFFSLLALNAYLFYLREKKQTMATALVSTLFFVLAILSKPSAVMVPFVGALINIFFAKRRMGLWLLGTWVLLSLPILFVTYQSQSNSDLPFTPPPLHLRPAVALYALEHYFEKLIFPMNLMLDYGYTPEAVVENPFFLFRAFLPLLLLGILVLFFRKQLSVWFALLTFVMALLPVLGIKPFLFQFLSTVSDRYAYFALLGPATAVAFLARSLNQRKEATAAFALLLTAMTVLTTKQVETWRSDLTLYTYTLKMRPNSWIAHHNLGAALILKKRWDEAAYHIRTAASLVSKPEVFFSLGLTELQLRNTDKAVGAFNRALILDPNNQPIYLNNLGAAWLQASNKSKAKYFFERALDLSPSMDQARHNLEQIKAPNQGRRQAQIVFPGG